MVKAPWTADQIKDLLLRQADPSMHAYTCGKCGMVLVPTTQGWLCPIAECDYVQDWAHMIDAMESFDELRTNGAIQCEICNSVHRPEQPCLPHELREKGKASPVSTSSVLSDTELVNWLAQQCFLPGDYPESGIFVVVPEEFAPLGAFTGNPEGDNKAFREALTRAMKNRNSNGGAPSPSGVIEDDSI